MGDVPLYRSPEAGGGKGGGRRGSMPSMVKSQAGQSATLVKSQTVLTLVKPPPKRPIVFHGFQRGSEEALRMPEDHGIS